MLTGQLEEAILSLDDLLLDPNNPRYADLGDTGRPTQIERVYQEQVQDKAMTRMMDDRFEVQQLKDSIRNIGFLHVDRLVVVELPQSGKYMVVEGNRRLAALKSLLKEEGEGDELRSEIKDSITNVPVVIIRDPDKTVRDHIARTLQGVRHVSSVKPWGPYQQAQLIAMMLDEGRTILEIKEVLGLSTQRINSLRRVYYALAQMREDSDYRDYAKPGLFSHFDEALKQRALRRWLEWDDEQSRCLNEENRTLFYAWCVGIEEDGERFPSKIVDAKHLRQLPDLLRDPIQFKRFREDTRLTLEDAARRIAHEDPEIDWRGILRSNLNTLRLVPALDLSQTTSEDIALFESVIQACNGLLQYTRAARDSAAAR